LKRLESSGSEASGSQASGSQASASQANATLCQQAKEQFAIEDAKEKEEFANQCRGGSEHQCWQYAQGQ
jgi:hypothetical protein